MNFQFKAGLICACLAVSLCHGQESETRMSEVTLKLVSLSGGGPTGPGGYDVVSLESGKIVHDGTIADLSTFRVPYGSYRIRFRGGLMSDPMSRDVEIDAPARFLLLGITGRAMHDDYPKRPGITFRLRPFTSCRPDGAMIGRLFAVYGSYSRERQIPSQGFLLFEPLEYGDYLLVVLDGDQVRATQVAKAWGQLSVIDVPLKDCKPAPK